jgi:hypothetical protein
MEVKSIEENTPNNIILSYGLQSMDLLLLNQNDPEVFIPYSFLANTSLDTWATRYYKNTFLVSFFEDEGNMYCNISIQIWGIVQDSMTFKYDPQTGEVQDTKNLTRKGKNPFILPQIPKNGELYKICSMQDKAQYGYPRTSLYELNIGFQSTYVGTVHSFIIPETQNDISYKIFRYERYSKSLLSYTCINNQSAFPFFDFFNLKIENYTIKGFIGRFLLVETNIDFHKFVNYNMIITFTIVGVSLVALIYIVNKMRKKHKKKFEIDLAGFV